MKLEQEFWFNLHTVRADSLLADFLLLVWRDYEPNWECISLLRYKGCRISIRVKSLVVRTSLEEKGKLEKTKQQPVKTNSDARSENLNSINSAISWRSTAPSLRGVETAELPHGAKWWCFSAILQPQHESVSSDSLMTLPHWMVRVKEFTCFPNFVVFWVTEWLEIIFFYTTQAEKHLRCH